MGLFTNRKRDDEADVADRSEAAEMLAQFNSPADDQATHVASVEHRSEEDPTTPLAGFPPGEPLPDFFPVGAVDDGAATPIAENADFLTFAADDETAVVPNRRLEDRPRAQAGNVEIDASGLLDMLGVGVFAGLLDISAAHQRFLADHQPVDGDDADSAAIKRAIRREVNTAYASFRLTHAA